MTAPLPKHRVSYHSHEAVSISSGPVPPMTARKWPRIWPQLGVDLEGDLPFDEQRCCVEVVEVVVDPIPGWEVHFSGEDEMLTPSPLCEEWCYLVWNLLGGFSAR